MTTTLAIQLEAGDGVPRTLKLSDVIMADKLTNWEDVKKPFENMNLHVEETEGVTKETMNQLEDVHAVMLGQSQHLEFELGQQYKYPVDAIDDSKATKNLKKK